MVVLCLSLSWYALLCVFYSFSIILKRKRELVALFFLLSYGCLVSVVTVLRVPWFGLQRAIVVFPDHTHSLFKIISCKISDRY